MSSILSQTHGVLRFPNQPKFRNSIFSPRDVPWSVEGKDVPLTVSCRRDPHTRRTAASLGRETSEDGEDGNVGERPRPNSPSQEDLIALFRRIQSSISEECRVDNSKGSAEKSSALSILKALGESEKKKQGVYNSKGSEEKLSGFSILKALRESEKKKQGESRNEETKRVVRNNVNSKSSLRPPSNFVRRSPIPSPTTPREISHELRNDARTSVEEAELGRERLPEMKLSQLKELAKSRGFKGYSKLKKSELVNLLNS